MKLKQDFFFGEIYCRHLFICGQLIARIIYNLNAEKFSFSSSAEVDQKDRYKFVYMNNSINHTMQWAIFVWQFSSKQNECKNIFSEISWTWQMFSGSVLRFYSKKCLITWTLKWNENDSDNNSGNIFFRQ